MGDTLDNFNPYFVAAFHALNAHCGGTARVGSGYRTIEEQRALLYKRSQGIAVADPGTSRHEGNHGGAIDIEFGDDQNKACIHANANAFGLNFGVPGEDWHIEFSDEGEAAALDGTFDEKFGVDAQQEQEQPEDDLSKIRDMIFGGADSEESIPDKVRRGFAPDKEPAAAIPAASRPLEATAGSTDGSVPPMSAPEAARYLAAAGFSGDALVTAVAIAMGESTLDPDRHGDQHLVGGGWGDSIGLMQIRSRTAGDEANGWRDGSRLEDPMFNAQAAFALSNGGTSFVPWTVWNEGIYKQYVDEAKAAVLAMGSAAIGNKGPPAASAQPDPLDPAEPDDKIFDPAGIANEIAEAMLARKGEAGSATKKVAEADISTDEDLTPSGRGII